MKLFNKILVVSALLIGLNIEGAIISTNTGGGASTGGNGTFLLSTNRASVYQVEITSPYSAYVQLFDMDTLASPFYGTNYTNAAYVVNSSYATNYAYSFVGNNGYTNWYTNQGQWYITTTNSNGTNALSPLAAFVVGANAYAVYQVDALFNRGITLLANTNVSIVINYRSAK